MQKISTAHSKHREILEVKWVYITLLFPITLLYFLTLASDIPTDIYGWIISISRIAGLWASGLLLLQLAIMARLPIFEKHISKDQLISIHRKAGFTSFWLMIGHIFLVLFGYERGLTDIVQKSWQTIRTEPGVLMSVLGFVFILLVVATSIKNVMAKINYESWHLLHLYAYAGAYLALPHQLWTGEDFLNHPAVAVFWWGLWIATAGLVIVYRVIGPLVQTAKHQLHISEIENMGDNLFRMVLTGRNLQNVDIQPGQAINIRFLTKKGYTISNPFSLSSINDGSWEVIFAAIGEGTKRMSVLPINTRILFEGPYGNLYSPSSEEKSLVLIGAGSGLAPLKSIARSADSQLKILMIGRVRSGEDVLMGHLQREFSGSNNVTCLPIVGSRGSKNPWLPDSVDGDKVMTYLKENYSEATFVICGAAPWVRSVRKSLAANGVKRQKIRSESFGWD